MLLYTPWRNQAACQRRDRTAFKRSGRAPFTTTRITGWSSFGRVDKENLARQNQATCKKSPAADSCQVCRISCFKGNKKSDQFSWQFIVYLMPEKINTSQRKHLTTKYSCFQASWMASRGHDLHRCKIVWLSAKTWEWIFLATPNNIVTKDLEWISVACSFECLDDITKWIIVVLTLSKLIKYN